MDHSEYIRGTIRPALPDEHRLLSRIALASKSHWPYPAESLAQWADDLTISRASLESDPTFVLELDGAVVAFYQLGHSEKGLALEHFWLLPASMGKGLGRRLLAHAAEQAVALGFSELIIDADPYAEGFYAACGARTIGAVPAPLPGEPDRQRPLMSLPCGGDRVAPEWSIR